MSRYSDERCRDNEREREGEEYKLAPVRPHMRRTLSADDVPHDVEMEERDRDRERLLAVKERVSEKCEKDEEDVEMGDEARLARRREKSRAGAPTPSEPTESARAVSSLLSLPSIVHAPSHESRPKRPRIVPTLPVPSHSFSIYITNACRC